MKVFYLYHRGYNISYLSPFLDLVKATKVKLEDVTLTSPEGHDVLIYQTFPNEAQPAKFNPNLVEATDPIFLGFIGLKILFDAHDEGYEDAFTRFDHLDPYPPTIKVFMDDMYPKREHVVYRPDEDEPKMFKYWLQSTLGRNKTAAKVLSRPFKYKVRKLTGEN